METEVQLVHSYVCCIVELTEADYSDVDLAVNSFISCEKCVKSSLVKYHLKNKNGL